MTIVSFDYYSCIVEWKVIYHVFGSIFYSNNPYNYWYIGAGVQKYHLLIYKYILLSSTLIQESPY